MNEEKNQDIKIRSVSLPVELDERIDDAAKRLGHKNVSRLIRELILKYLDLMLNETGDVPIILRIPSDILDDPKAIRQWLEVKVDVVVKALSK